MSQSQYSSTPPNKNRKWLALIIIIGACILWLAVFGTLIRFCISYFVIQGDSFAGSLFGGIFSGAQGNNPGYSDVITPEPAATTPSEMQAGEGDIGAYHVKILEAQLGKTVFDDDVIIVTYEWTNNSSESTSFLVALTADAYQDGVECSFGLITNDAYPFFGNELKDILPGATLKVQKAYKVENDISTVDVVVTRGPLSYPKDVTVEKQFAIK